MSASRVLLLQTLIDKGACQEQVDLFRVRFGESVMVTREVAMEVAPLFIWDWAAYFLVSGRHDEYKLKKWAAFDAYVRSTSVLWEEECGSAEYQRALAAAFADAYIHDEAPAMSTLTEAADALRKCTCGCTTGEYSDHTFSCPFYVAGKAERHAEGHSMKLRGSYSFDSMCLGLVKHFYPEIDDEHAAELAQRLQDCVEDFGRELKVQS